MPASNAGGNATGKLISVAWLLLIVLACLAVVAR